MSDVTELLRRASSDDRSAIDELFALLYKDVRRMAHGRLIGECADFAPQHNGGRQRGLSAPL